VHYDGSSWSVASPPTVNGAAFTLDGVAAVSPRDVWVVGEDEQTGRAHTARWDGAAWKLYPIYKPSTVKLNAVAAVPGTHALWAAGTRIPDAGQSIVAHFNGSTWRRMRAPGHGELTSVAVHSAHDVWAVGANCFAAEPCPIIDRWNGTTWRSVTGVGVKLDIPEAVAIVPGSNHAWVVGVHDGNTPQPFAEFFGGRTWTRTPVPKLPYGGMLLDVVAVSAKNAWAVGEIDDNNGNQVAPLVEHWDGTSWTQSALPASPHTQNRLNGVARVPGSTETWAAGWSSALPAFSMRILSHP
jgi:hypothetical protein